MLAVAMQVENIYGGLRRIICRAGPEGVRVYPFSSLMVRDFAAYVDFSEGEDRRLCGIVKVSFSPLAYADVLLTFNKITWATSKFYFWEMWDQLATISAYIIKRGTTLLATGWPMFVGRI